MSRIKDHYSEKQHGEVQFTAREEKYEGNQHIFRKTNK